MRSDASCSTRSSSSDRPCNSRAGAISGVQYGPGPSPNHRTRRATTSDLTGSSFGANVKRARGRRPWTTVFVGRLRRALVERRPAVHRRNRAARRECPPRAAARRCPGRCGRFTSPARCMRPFDEQRHGHDVLGIRAGEPLETRAGREADAVVRRHDNQRLVEQILVPQSRGSAAARTPIDETDLQEMTRVPLRHRPFVRRPSAERDAGKSSLQTGPLT